MLPMHRTILVLAVFFGFFVAAALATDIARLELQSSAFAPNTTIPMPYVCVDASGAGKSPPLAWHGAPATTKTFALIVRDPDAPGGSFVHWVIYNLSANTTKLDDDMPKTDTVPGGGEQGVNGLGAVGYLGPCPPPGRPHHYHFHLYAIDSELKIKPDAAADDVEQAAKGHTLAEADLVGIFER